MGSILYDFLSSSIFFDAEALNTGFEKESLSRLEKELADYRAFCINNYEKVIGEVSESKSFLKVFSSTIGTPISLLKQTSLYVEQFIIADPLFALSQEKSESIANAGLYLGYAENGLDKNRLADACKFLQVITPMIAADYVKLFPLTLFFERKTIPFYAPDNQFFDILPSDILNFFRDNAIVKPMQRLESGGWMQLNRNLFPCRGISVEFNDSDKLRGLVYHLLQSEVVSMNEETREVVFRQSLPATPPPQDEFDAWVNQSINSASKHYFDEVFLENIIAANLSATYLSNNILTGKLLSQHIGARENIQTTTANHVLNFELPFLEKVDIDELMAIRTEDGDSFTNFRLELEKHLRELRTIEDEALLEKKRENIIHELNNVQVEKVNQKMKQVRKKLRTDLLLGVAGLLPCVQTGGLSLLATATAIGKGFKDYNDYIKNVKENPSYILWKLKKSVKSN